MRNDDNLPQGISAAVFPNAVYNIPGLFQFSPLIYRYLDHAERKFGYHIPIKYLYGAPPVKWNGGRLLRQEVPALSAIEGELRDTASNGIIPLVTFSNALVSESDLGDPLCNRILRSLEDVSGGAIVSSDMLLRYIRESYPGIRIHASVIICAAEPDRTATYYQELSSQYDQYVVHPDDLYNIGLLLKIPSRNADLLINERCFRGCPIRREHYTSISREQINRTDSTVIDENFLDHCAAIPEHKQLDCKRRNISLSIAETQQLLDLGFGTIKLQGRTDALPVFFFDLMRYTLEPEAAFPAMFPAFFYEIQDYLKRR